MIPKDLITIKYFLGKPWLKLFYQFVTTSVDYFENDEEDFLFHNTRTKFSIFKYIDTKFKYEGFYEFLLEYPSVDGYNHWRQGVFPLDDDEASGNTDINYNQNGYSCSWTGKDWNGLRRSSMTANAFLDGSDSSRHYYEIGVKGMYHEELTFPGPGKSEDDYYLVSQVLLWILIPPHLYSKMFLKSIKTRSYNLDIILKYSLFICIN